MKNEENKKTVRISALAMLVLAAAMAVVWGCDTGTGSGEQPQQPRITIDVTPAPSQLTVEWNSIEDCEKYEVWLDGEVHCETPVTMKVITGLTNERKYTVQVRANINGKFIYSNSVIIFPDRHNEIPAIPTEIKITSDDQFLIASWQAAVGATSYQVYVGDALFSEVYEPRAEIDGLENGVLYTVRIKSKNSAGTSEQSEGKSKSPDPYFKKAKIGMGFNLFGSLSSASVSLRPILNLDKLNQENVYLIEGETKSDWSVRTGETINEVNKGQNQSISMGASMPFQGILLSAGASAGYRRNSSTTTKSHYASIRAEHFIKTVALTPMMYEPLEMRPYFTDGFLYALDNETPRELFTHYGHALLLKYRLGGNQEIYVTHFNSQKETFEKFRAGFNTDVKVLGFSLGASVRGETSSTTSTSEWRSDSEISFSSSGGSLSHALTLEGAFAEYPSWVDSIERFPEFAGVESYLNSYIPLWDIAKSLGKAALAYSLREEFISQAMKRVDDLEAVWPGEWFSFEEKRYTPGSAVFNHPIQYVTDEDGNKFPAMIKYVFYVAGAGAGGRGHSEWGNSGWLDGGAGAGGALIKIVVKSNEGISASLFIGQGGSGGTAMKGHAWDGPGVTPGGDSSIVLYGQTITAGGGQYSGYTNYMYFPAPGGVGSPLAPPDFADDYVIADGLQTNGDWNKPGAGGTIDNFSAGAGGIGGTYGGRGFVGEDGWAMVRWYYYDGQ